MKNHAVQGNLLLVAGFVSIIFTSPAACSLSSGSHQRETGREKAREGGVEKSANWAGSAGRDEVGGTVDENGYARDSGERISYSIDSGSVEPDASNKPEGASCQVGDQVYLSGSMNIAAPVGCGSCTCNNGILSCVENDCPIATPVIPCPTESNIVSDPVEVTYASILNSTLTLNISHKGGCARHDYALCFDELSPDYANNAIFYKPYPPYINTRLIHHANGETCEARLSRILKIDLTPTADMIKRLLPYVTSGVVQIQYGFYTFGELTCEEKSLVAELIVSDARKRANKCSNDSDCMANTVVTNCYFGCNQAVISAAYKNEFENALINIEESTCRNYENKSCSPVSTHPCISPPPIACIDGTCTARTPSLCKLRYDPGPCESRNYVYTFDPILRACVPAVYGGCGGNENRFETLEDCENTCNPARLLPDCPPERVLVRDCVEGHPIAGCGQYAWVCAKQCLKEAEENPCAEENFLGWSSSPYSCITGYCLRGVFSPL